MGKKRDPKQEIINKQARRIVEIRDSVDRYVETVDEQAARIVRLTEERDEHLTDLQYVVKKHAEGPGNLEGYRELGARAAVAESKIDDLKADLARVTSERDAVRTRACAPSVFAELWGVKRGDVVRVHRYGEEGQPHVIADVKAREVLACEQGAHGTFGIGDFIRLFSADEFTCLHRAEDYDEEGNVSTLLTDRTTDQDLANGHLMAAAPAMLEALEGVLDLSYDLVATAKRRVLTEADMAEIAPAFEAATTAAQKARGEEASDGR